MNRSTLISLILLCSMGTAAAAAPESSSPQDTTDQVIINAQREKLHVLHAQIVKLEDRIYADYNKLNQDHQYDIVCTQDVSTGSHLRDRQCLPVFARSAREGEAADFLSQFGLDGHPAPPHSMEILKKQQDFIKNYRSVINSHPELRKLDQEYGGLVKHYDAVRSEKLKGKTLVWD